MFRLLHISDLHISALPFIGRKDNVANDSILLGVAKALHKYANEVDAILITGDIADSGNQEDLEKALSFIKDPGLPNVPYLSSCEYPTISQHNQKPIFVIPGNHDRFVSYFLQPSGGGNFDEVFKKQWGSRLGGVKTFYYPNEDSPKFAIIGADFTLKNVPGILPFWIPRLLKKTTMYGKGKIYADRLDELVGQTNEAKKKCPVIWATHFPPEFQNVRHFDKSLQLHDEYLLVSLAEESQVRHILSGHSHKCSSYKSSSSEHVTVHCCGTSACSKLSSEDTVIHIRNIKFDSISNDIDIYSDTYRWNKKKLKFIQEDNCIHGHCKGMCSGIKK